MTRVAGGWLYRDGTVWPTLDGLRDHILGVVRTEASDRLVTAWR